MLCVLPNPLNECSAGVHEKKNLNNHLSIPFSPILEDCKGITRVACTQYFSGKKKDESGKKKKRRKEVGRKG